MQFPPALVRQNRHGLAPVPGYAGSGSLQRYIRLDDFQAVPEAILLDPLPEFRTGDQCELMYRDELSLVGWPKGCRMDRTLAGAHGRRGSIRAVIHRGEGAVVRRLGLTARGGHPSNR